jgi:aryl-phospho-beta-D-glucosidase BglC (GH1 family)
LKRNWTIHYAQVLVLAMFAFFSSTSASLAIVGVNVSGSEYSWETYPIASQVDYLQTEGIVLIRLPIAWEKLQSTLNGPLTQGEITNLKSFLDLAASRGMQVIVDIHNYARYNPNWAADAAANGGIVGPDAPDALPIGSSSVPISAFQDFWTKLAGVLAGHAALGGYDIMNEPFGLGPGVWPTAAQAAVNGIRSVDMSTTIYVEGEQWASAYSWPSVNGSLKISDPANNLIYEAHLYFDSNGRGTYAQTYDQQGAYPNWGVDHVQPFLQWLQQNGAKGYLGEFGVPENDPRWLTVLDNFLNTLQQNGIPGTYWYYAYPDPSSTNSWWPIMSGTDFYMSLVPFANGQDKPQWSIIAKYNLGQPTSLRLIQ